MSVLFFFPKIAPKVFDKKNPASLEVPTLDAMALTTSAFSVSFSVGGVLGRMGTCKVGLMLWYKWSYNSLINGRFKWVTGIITLLIGGYNSRPNLAGIVLRF